MANPKYGVPKVVAPDSSVGRLLSGGAGSVDDPQVFGYAPESPLGLKDTLTVTAVPVAGSHSGAWQAVYGGILADLLTAFPFPGTLASEGALDSEEGQPILPVLVGGKVLVTLFTGVDDRINQHAEGNPDSPYFFDGDTWVANEDFVYADVASDWADHFARYAVVCRSYVVWAYQLSQDRFTFNVDGIVASDFNGDGDQVFLVLDESFRGAGPDGDGNLYVDGWPILQDVYAAAILEYVGALGAAFQGTDPSSGPLVAAIQGFFA